MFVSRLFVLEIDAAVGKEKFAKAVEGKEMLLSYIFQMLLSGIIQMLLSGIIQRICRVGLYK